MEDCPGERKSTFTPRQHSRREVDTISVKLDLEHLSQFSPFMYKQERYFRDHLVLWDFICFSMDRDLVVQGFPSYHFGS